MSDGLSWLGAVISLGFLGVVITVSGVNHAIGDLVDATNNSNECIVEVAENDDVR